MGKRRRKNIGQQSPPNAPPVSVSDSEPEPPSPDWPPGAPPLPPGMAPGGMIPKTSPRAERWFVVLLACHDGRRPRHHSTRCPGPQPGDAVAAALGELATVHPDWSVTTAKCWPATGGSR